MGAQAKLRRWHRESACFKWALKARSPPFLHSFDNNDHPGLSVVYSTLSASLLSSLCLACSDHRAHFSPPMTANDGNLDLQWCTPRCPRPLHALLRRRPSTCNRPYSPLSPTAARTSSGVFHVVAAVSAVSAVSFASRPSKRTRTCPPWLSSQRW